MVKDAGNARAKSPFKHVRRHHRHAPRPAAVAPRRPYDRQTELPRVLPLWPHELNDESADGRWRVLGKLRRALRAERRRGVAGHWTYDLARHAELLRVYRLELAAAPGPPPGPLEAGRLGALLAFHPRRSRRDGG
jgi:hypothetical protein